MSITPSSEVIARVRQRHLMELLERGKRIEERDLFAYREIKVEKGPGRACGSAMISIGNTKVISAVKVETGAPFPDTPDEGVLVVNAELVPLASPTFEPGPPDENAIELARIIDRALRGSKAIDLSKLCIIPGKKVLTVFVDIFILNYDGNLADASSLATMKALLDAKIPKYVLERDEVKFLEETTALPIQNIPLLVTFAKINDKMVIDPSLAEEQVAQAMLTIGIDKEGNICAIQKSGPGTISTSMILEMVKKAREKAEELRKILLA